MKAIWMRNTPYSKFLITVGIILLSAVIFTFFSSILASVFYGVSVEELQAIMSDMTSPKAMAVFRMVQTVSAIGTFLVPPLLLAYFFSEKPKEYLSLDKKPKQHSWFLVVLLMLFATPFINFLGELNSRMHLPAVLKTVEDWMRASEDQAAQLTKAFLDMKSTSDFVFNLFMIGLLPAVGEELVFRGIVQRIFSEWWKNKHAAIWTTAFVFSAMHMQFYGFVPRMVLGGMMGYMLVWSGSLWLPILAHFVNNAGAVVFMFLFQQGITSIDPDKIGTESDVVSVSISLVVTAGLLIMLKKRENAAQSQAIS